MAMMRAGGPGGDPRVSGGVPIDPGTGTATSQPSTPGWLSDLTTLSQLGGNLYGLYDAGQLRSSAGTVFQQSNPFGGYRPYYGSQLLQLMQDPSSIAKQPGYQFLLNQGVQAIDRSAAGPGGVGLGSGGEKIELMQYGQGLADQFYQQQIQTLSQLAGANFPPADPYSALRGLGGAASSVGGSIQGLASSIPGIANMISRYFPGSTPDTSTYSDTGVYGGAFGGGAPLYDPATGGYPGTSTAGLPTDASGNVDWGIPSSTDTGSIDLSGMFTNPRTAGGEAAGTSSGKTSLGQIFETGSQIAGIGVGLMQGGPYGYGSALSSGAGLLSKYPGLLGMNEQTAGKIETGAGIAEDVLGLYGGIKEGGLMGGATAATSAASLATTAGLFGGPTGALGTAVGYAGPGLGLIAGIQQGGPLGYSEAALNAYQLAHMIALAQGGSAAGAAGATAGTAAGSSGTSAGAGAVAVPLTAVAVLAAIDEYLTSQEPPTVPFTGSNWSGNPYSYGKGGVSGIGIGPGGGATPRWVRP